MIPSDLEEKHFLEAASHIDREGVPFPRRSVHYDLVLGGNRYPPKYIISLANRFASGIDYPSNKFNAVEAVNYFRVHKYQVIDRRQSVASVILSEDEDSAFPEGKENYRRHRKRERNTKIAIKAKENRMLKSGRLQCDVCSFDFKETYGKLGEGFIEAHHTLPLSTLKGQSKTKLSDIILVCSNCHRMLHRGEKLLSITELFQIIKNR